MASNSLVYRGEARYGALCGATGGESCLAGRPGLPPSRADAPRPDQRSRWIALQPCPDEAIEAWSWLPRWVAAGVEGLVVAAGALTPDGLTAETEAACRPILAEARSAGLAVAIRVEIGAVDPSLAARNPGFVARDGHGIPIPTVGGGLAACISSAYLRAIVPNALAAVAERMRPDVLLGAGWSGPAADQICHCAACAVAFEASTGLGLPDAVSWDDPRYISWVLWSRGLRSAAWRAEEAAMLNTGTGCVWTGLLPLERTERAHRLIDEAGTAAASSLVFTARTARRGKGRFRDGIDEIRYLADRCAGARIVVLAPACHGESGLFRSVAAPAAEIRRDIIAVMAAGAGPGLALDRTASTDPRGLEAALPFFAWHHAHLTGGAGVRAAAAVGLVWSEQSANVQARAEAALLAVAPYRGMVHALVRAGLAYRPIGDELASADLSGLSVLVLPNVAAMSDAQITAAKRFVRDGGTLVATGETSLYTAAGTARADYALADVFGAHIIGAVPDRFEAITRQQPRGPLDGPGPALGKLKGPATDHTYLRLVPERAGAAYGPAGPDFLREPGVRHAILAGFDDTDLLAFGGLLRPVGIDPGRIVPLTYVPPFPNFPIDEVYPRDPRTTIPGLVLGSYGRGRVAFMPADLDRRFGIDPIPDHGTLLVNLLRWAAGPDTAMIVSSGGVVSATLSAEVGRLVVHLVNLTGCDNQSGAIDHVVPLGPVRVSLALPAGVSGAAADTCVSGARPETTRTGQEGSRRIDIVLPRLDEHELVIVT